jgi:hypothetical protein
MTRLCLFSPVLAAQLSLRILRALHARFGGLDTLDRVAPDRLAVARFLFARVLPAALVDALDAIERFATDLGREALLEAARTRSTPVPVAWLTLPALDLAARVVLDAQRKDARGNDARAILKRAHVRVGRYFSPRVSYEVALPGAIDRADALLTAGREVHEGALVASWTAVHGDVVHAAFGDPARITTRPAFTLRPPHEEGPAWFDAKALPASIRGGTVVGCDVDDGARTTVRSPTALADAHLRLGARGGYLVRMTERFDVVSNETADATIELPNKLTIADARFEEDIRDAIDAQRLTTPGVLPDDLGSLAPHEHAAWRWTESVTARGFDDAVAAGLLVRVPASRRAADAAHRSYGSSLRVHDLPGEDTKYALADDMSVHAYDVPPGATVRWKLDPARFAASLASRLQLEPPCLKRAARVPEGLLPIGVLDAQGAKACIFQLMRIVRDGDAGDVREGLRVACGTALPVVLVGNERTLGKGIAQVEVELARLLAGDDLGDVLAEVAEALGVEDELDAWRFGTRDKPLVILVERGEAWFGKVRLRITANQFAMLVVLARTAGASGGWVTVSELGTRISPHAGHPDVVVRRARARVGAADRRELRARGGRDARGGRGKDRRDRSGEGDVSARGGRGGAGGVDARGWRAATLNSSPCFTERALRSPRGSSCASPSRRR